MLIRLAFICHHSVSMGFECARAIHTLLFTEENAVFLLFVFIVVHPALDKTVLFPLFCQNQLRGEQKSICFIWQEEQSH